MKNYEVIIQQRQPSCGGRLPFESEIRNVSTDDPVAYVREKEPSCPLEITEEDGALVISAERSRGLWARYEFYED